MENLNATLLSQYANSPIILSLLVNMNEAIDPAEDIDMFYDKVWNILTAEGWGLDFWGRVVGVSRTLTIPGDINTFDFEESGVSGNGFGQQSFYAGPPASQNYELSDEAYRALILVKALSNISNSSISTYNRMLMQLFPGRGNAYVVDLGNMVARLTFEFTLQPFEVAILKQSGAFTGPTGVLMEIMDVNIPYSFGFQEAGTSSAGFNNGTFFSGYA